MPQVYAGQRVTATELSLTYSASDIGAVTVTAATLTDLTAAFTVPANDSAVGNIYEIESWGYGTWGSTAQDAVFTISFGGNNMASIDYDAGLFNTNQAFRWRMVARVVCLSTGATGTFSSLLHGEISVYNHSLNVANGAASTTIAGVACESTGTTTIDTTAAQSLKLRFNWASVTGAPTITKNVAIQRKLGVG